MLDEIRIYADFQKSDRDGRLILSCQGTQQDLNHYGVELREGMVLTLYSDDADDEGNPDDLIVKGEIHYDEKAKYWTATIDWAAIIHASDLKTIESQQAAA